MNRKLVDETLEEAKALGIRNILALRGDPPRSEEYHIDEEEDSNKDFNWAIDLVKYIRKVHGDYFCIGVAGYPEGHADESHPEHQSVERDLPFLVAKTSAGADFIMTQLTYDLDAYSKYEHRLRTHESGIFKTIPIIPGLMPIQSYQILKRITHLSHVKIPKPILSRVKVVKNNDEAVKRVGVDILSEIVEGMKPLPSPASQSRGFHFFTLNLEKSVSFILERCNLIPASTESASPASSDVDSDIAVEVNIDPNSTLADKSAQSSSPQSSRQRRRSSVLNSQPHNRLIVDRPSISVSNPSSTTRPQSHHSDSSTTTRIHEAPATGSGLPAGQSKPSTTLLISEGMGSLGREATWDDFPNGRWGPSNSPAFGEIDGYGPSLHVTPAQARNLWGYPRSAQDITTIFARHVRSEISCVPWSDESESGGALREETLTIKDELLRLIEGKGWWTLASQPAVNGRKSDDPVFGWGPEGEGFVFQKAFVEFFIPTKQWQQELRPWLLRYGDDELSWLSTNVKRDFESSTIITSRPNGQRNIWTDGFHASSSSGGGGTRNAVTWGVFRGHEIMTPTIIEEESFRAWSDEAYGIWDEWRRVFPRGSAEERFLSRCREDVVLVNVVGQKFVGQDGGRLWRILAGEEL